MHPAAPLNEIICLTPQQRLDNSIKSGLRIDSAAKQLLLQTAEFVK